MFARAAGSDYAGDVVTELCDVSGVVGEAGDGIGGEAAWIRYTDKNHIMVEGDGTR